MQSARWIAISRNGNNIEIAIHVKILIETEIHTTNLSKTSVRSSTKIMINYERIVELPIFPSFLIRTIPLVFFANLERTVRGRATNPAKLSRTPAELFSESGSWLPLSSAGEDQCVRQRARKFFRSLSGQPACFCTGKWTRGPRGNHAREDLGEMVTVASPDDTCFPYPAQSHFHRRRSVYTRCRTRPTNIFLGKILSPGTQRPASDVIMRSQQDCEPERCFK